MAIAGKIVVQLSAETENAAKGLTDFGGRVKKFETETTAAASSVAAEMFDVGDAFKELGRAADLDFVVEGINVFREKLEQSGEVVEHVGERLAHVVERVRDFGKETIKSFGEGGRAVLEFAGRVAGTVGGIVSGSTKIGSVFGRVSRLFNLDSIRHGLVDLSRQIDTNAKEFDRWIATAKDIGNRLMAAGAAAKTFAKSITDIRAADLLAVAKAARTSASAFLENTRNLGATKWRAFIGTVQTARKELLNLSTIKAIGVGLVKAPGNIGSALGAGAMTGIKKLGSATAAIGVTALSKIGSLGKSALGGLGSLAMSAAKGFAQLGLAIAATAAAAVSGLAVLAFEQAKSIVQTTRMAERLGTVPSALVAFGLAAKDAGVDSELANKGIENMMRSIGDAKRGSTAAQQAFKSLGLDVKQLARMDSVEAMKQVSDKIKELPTQADKAALAMQIFGKSGGALLPLLQKGSEGIDEAAREAKKLGLTFNAVEGRKVEQAMIALENMGNVVKGLGTQIAIQVAPYVQAVAEYFTQAATNGWDMGKVVSTALSWIAKGVGIVADVVHTFGLGFKYTQALATQGIAILAQAFVWGAGVWDNTFGKILEKLGLMKGGFKDAAQAIQTDLQRLADEQFAAADAALMAPPPSEKIDKFVAEINATAAANRNATEAVSEHANAEKELNKQLTDTAVAVADLQKKLQSEIDNFGMSADETAIAKLKKQVKELYDAGKTTEADALSAQIKKTEELNRQLAIMREQKEAQDKLRDSIKDANKEFVSPKQKLENRLKELEKMREGFTDPHTGETHKLDPEAFERAKKAAVKEFESVGKELEEAAMTPMEKYQNRLKELQELLDEGSISQRAFDKAKKTAQRDILGKGKEFGGALELGSAEASSLLLKNRFGAGGDTGIDAVAKNTTNIAKKADQAYNLQYRQWLLQQNQQQPQVFTMN